MFFSWSSRDFCSCRTLIFSAATLPSTDCAATICTFTYAYFSVEDPYDRVRDFTIHERLPDGREVSVEPDYAFHTITPPEGFKAQ